MRFLYIFPHPDDESFGPTAAIHRQLKAGHEVFLYTRTKGEATRHRFRLGVDKAEMGEIRLKEMQAVAQTVGLTGMTVDDYPDSGFQEMDPRILERAVRAHIEEIRPDIVVSYPVHGISGFHDHLVTHAVVKRVYLEMKEEGLAFPQRLAFLTLPDDEKSAFRSGSVHFKQSAPHLIDCIMHLSEEEVEMFKATLSCYETYQSTIKESKVVEKIGDTLYFEFFQEEVDPPVENIEDGMGEK
jgi:LmbE family N-acetylglucosaminyl deacetylase